MDVVRLGPKGNTLYLPDELIEGYSSCVWAERFTTDGDFTIISPHVDEMKALIPEGTLLSHLETDEVMIVDTHEEDLDEDDHPVVTIKGTSVTSIFGDRYVEAKYKKKRKMRKSYSGANAAAVLMWQALDNNSGFDVTRGDRNAETAEENSYSWNTKDRVPNVSITDSMAVDGAVKRRWLTEGLLLPQLQAILQKEDVGLRTIRPDESGSGTTAKIVTVKTVLADRGDVVKTDTSNIMSLRFDLYDGVDRTTGDNAVKFSVLQGDLDNAKKLFSEKGYKTVVEIISSVGIQDLYREGTSNFEGFDRRVMQLDAGEPDIPPEPEKPAELRKNATRQEREARQDAMDVYLEKHSNWVTKKNNIIAEFKEDALDDAKAELKKSRKVNQFSGSVSPSSPYIYRVNYNLGDSVLLTGNDGVEQKMVVEEYIRTENENGDSGFPGLVLP